MRLPTLVGLPSHARFLRMAGLPTLAILLIGAIAAAAEPKQLLLIGQKRDDHPPGTHEYMAGQERLAKLLSGIDAVQTKVVSADEPWSEGPELLDKADGAVIFVSQGAKWASDDPRRLDSLTKLAARGGGLMGLHWGIGCKPAEPIAAYLKLIGGCHGGPDRKYQVLDAKITLPAPQHPIVRGLQPFEVHDEFYYKLKFVKPEGSVQPILQATIDGTPETVCWAWERLDGGRSFGFSGLHFDPNWDRPEYRRLIAQAALWSLKLDPSLYSGN